MKKRDLLWISGLIRFFLIIAAFVGIFFYSIVQFNTSYIQEEKGELNVFEKQIEWAAIPFIKNNDLKGLKNYANDFKGEDVKFRIFDKNKKIMASSNPDDLSPIAKKDSKVLNKKKKWKIYRHSIKDKKIVAIEEFEINNSKYYIELTLLEEKVIGKIVKAQFQLIVLSAVCMVLLLLGIFELIYKVRREFNKFDHSVLKIANGELDTILDVPKSGLLEELAISVKKMTARLKKQIARLEKLEEYKSEFIQNISHEIKTPITAINMALELSENSADAEQNKECFEIIQFQIKAINKLVNDILTLSEIDVEKTSELKQFKKFNLNNTIEKAINSFEKGSIKINFSANSSVDFSGDENLIRSAIENLTANAIRYSNSDKIDISLLKENNEIKISVKDYGAGIKKEFQEKIFEKFFRIDKARSRKKGGTGLGLAIVKNIVELHEGKISLISEENKGAEFVIELPLTV